MTSYFIDYAAGDDTNSGTSTATPFRHCPGDANATGTAASTTLASGDTVYFKGGVIYRGTIAISWSGSAGSYITYDGAGVSWGSGRAEWSGKDDGGVFAYGSAFDSAANKSYIKIQGFDFREARNQTLATPDGVIRMDAGDSDWTIDDCIFHEHEDWADTEPVGGSGGTIKAQQVSIYIKGSSSTAINDITIMDCEFYAHGDTCIYGVYADGVDITGCNFGGISRPSGYEGYFSVGVKIGSGNSNWTISRCTFHDGWQYEGDEATVKAHAGDWIHIYGTAGVEPSDMLIERNFFFNNKAFSYSHATAMSFVEDACQRITYRNNIFVNPHALNGAIKVAEADYVDIYNNTFVTYGAVNEASRCLFAGTGLGNNSNIKNNVFVHYGSDAAYAALHIYDTGWAGACDYNSFYCPNGAPVASLSTTQYSTLSAWQLATTFDDNSIEGDPALLSVPATGATSGSGNYHLTNASACRDAAADLSSSFTDDYDGDTRSAWDIGADEYQAGGQPRRTINNKRRMND